MPQEKKQQAKTSFPQMEEEVLKFWQENKIFEKSLDKPTPSPSQEGNAKGDYVFYDGPPFATGTPHYGHIVASAMKDVIPRFKTMQGFRVERKWGWDCHGLPVENLVEKDLDLKTKKDIEEMGIDKFNEACRTSVMRYADEWKKFIPRMGRWVDMENDYKTMNPEYMESIWWVFGQLYKKGLIYEGYKSMHLCPRCETTLSNFEVTQGYKDVKDLSVTAKFKLKPGQNIERSSTDKKVAAILCTSESPWLTTNDNTYILAWTTTPWTLLGNVALAVGVRGNIGYQILEFKNDCNILKSKRGDKIIIANNRGIERNIFGGIIYEHKTGSTHQNKQYYVNYNKNITEKIEFVNRKIIDSGQQLVGLEYEPLFDYFAKRGLTPLKGVEPLAGNENGWKIYAGDFVNTDEGTGIVHIAPAFGDDDMNMGKEHNLPFVQHVKMNGQFVDEVTDFAGKEVKPKDNPSETDIEIIKWLARNNKLFSKEKYEHSYPHCWRCDTPLLNYATSSWFVSVTKIKEKLLKNNKKTNWVPEHIRDGRFGKWLEGARDWAISRSRFWGTPLPVWRCECGEIKVIGSIEELEKLSGQKVDDLHKQFVDKIEIKCEKCGGVMKRIPEVLDCWFESGSMPYASFHYPFENKEKFEKNFPARFIAEGVDQTRGWFYTLMVLSTALFDKPAFKNVIVNGIVQAEDGQKMSKRLKNYPDPNELIGKYGADAMRYYLMSSPVVKGGDLNFSEKGVDEVFKKVIMLLWNVYGFFETYQDQLVDNTQTPPNPPCQGGTSENVLDKWILAKLNLLINEVTENLEKYDLQKASRPIVEFINELSTWYLRRSRERFKYGDDEDKQNALATTNYVLLTLSKLMAPFTPFIAESLYQKVKGDDGRESVHLEEWPEVELKMKNEELKIIEKMKKTRDICSESLQLRAKAGKKIRQILSTLNLETNNSKELTDEYINLIKDEVNVKEIILKETSLPTGDAISEVIITQLNTKITHELELEGYAREIVRTINLLRKDAGLSINDSAEIYYNDSNIIKEVFAKHGDDILKDTLCTKYEAADMDEAEMKKEVKIGEKRVEVGIKS